jgi:hypothetical protein
MNTKTVRAVENLAIALLVVTLFIGSVAAVVAMVTWASNEIEDHAAAKLAPPEAAGPQPIFEANQGLWVYAFQTDEVECFVAVSAVGDTDMVCHSLPQIVPVQPTGPGAPKSEQPPTPGHSL